MYLRVVVYVEEDNGVHFKMQDYETIIEYVLLFMFSLTKKIIEYIVMTIYTHTHIYREIIWVLDQIKVLIHSNILSNVLGK